MNENHKELISIGLTLVIIAFTLYIIHKFIPSIIWAGIIAIATYPLYKKWKKLFGSYSNLSSLLFTTILSLVILVPLSWLITILIKELQLFINYLQLINKEGGAVPDFIKQFPFIGNEIAAYWDANIGHPGNVRNFISNLHNSLSPATYYIKQVGIDIVHRSFQLGFTFLTLFFFFRDAESLLFEINRIGEACLGRRWFRYANRLPSALQGTVNGTIVVGLGVGVLMGICYALLNVPAPTLLGLITAMAAMIPFVVPLVFISVALILLANSSMIAAIIVLVWGTVVMFVADHFIKPVLIGGAIQLPFLAVLFGILGGVETLGLLGLFVGPIVMVLFITLWYEPQDNKLLHEF